MTAPRLLPPEFAEFENYAQTWCLATERERYAQRMSSSMSEMLPFYNAFFPQLEEAVAYCDKFPLDDMPDDAVNLLHLVYSLVTVSMSVEIFHQPKVVDSAAARIDRVKEPFP
ncbi:hypothetical protein ACFWB0_06290 [Rhodococcus sp. NPDC060086]|uniref:hypothetical protein n=1 Tax=Rhodococcus sp. NPDC060086 TaxID=3347055 RepID=UPI00366993E1